MEEESGEGREEEGGEGDDSGWGSQDGGGGGGDVADCLLTKRGPQAQEQQAGQECQENHQEQNRQQNLQLGPPPQELDPTLPETHL